MCFCESLGNMVDIVSHVGCLGFSCRAISKISDIQTQILASSSGGINQAMLFIVLKGKTNTNPCFEREFFALF